MDPVTLQAFNDLAAYLRQIGLGALFSVDSEGNPGGWLWNQIQQGIDSPDEIRLRLEQTDIFRDRFGIILAQQEQAARGEPVYVMSPGEVIEYERAATQIFAAAGLPSTFYDDPQDFHQLIAQDMSVAEVQQRVQQAYDYVLAAPPEVRAAMDEFYGVGQGEAQLAAWALDPERTVRDINRATRTAYTAGIANRFDIDLDRRAAERIADLPMTEEGITSGLRNVAGQRGIFEESIGERGTDLTVDTGIDATFEGDADAQRAIARRVAERRAAERAPTGGAAIGSEGVIGAGTG